MTTYITRLTCATARPGGKGSRPPCKAFSFEVLGGFGGNVGVDVMMGRRIFLHDGVPSQRTDVSTQRGNIGGVGWRQDLQFLQFP